MSAPNIIRPSVVIGGGYTLIDHHGRIVTDATFHGCFPLIFFGFTHCRVVCPQSLDRLGRALDLLGSDADHVRPLYITVDPARDTPDVMKTFLVTRFPRFTGLTGPKDEIDSMKRMFKVYAEREQADAEGNYDVPHTAMTFLMSPDGSYLTHFGDAATAEQIAAGVRARINASASDENNPVD